MCSSDLADYADAISYGGGQNFYLDSKKAALEAEDFTPAFTVENMQKDVGLALRLASRSGLQLPAEEKVAEVYARAVAAGFAKEDFSASFKAVRQK